MYVYVWVWRNIFYLMFKHIKLFVNKKLKKKCALVEYWIMFNEIKINHDKL